MKGEEEAKEASSASSPPKKNRDALYAYDADLVKALENEKPWEKDVKYFTKIKVSALASMKMLKHALEGVEKGTRSNHGYPFEVMGLLLGKPDANTIIIMDCFPLPVEGTEIKVVADDEHVIAHMIDISESLEITRKEKFIGWYHSHPFDVGIASQCFLSPTDIMTQLSWQRQLDPWVAIVVDPLRSLAKQEPQFGAFRCYPPNYSPPDNECCDGATTLAMDDHGKILRWGKLHNRYYALDISYFMSSLSKQMLGIMAKNSLWIKILSGCSIREPENRARFPERVRHMTRKLKTGDLGGGERFPGKSALPSTNSENLSKASQALSELSIEQAQGHASQITKNALFSC